MPDRCDFPQRSFVPSQPVLRALLADRFFLVDAPGLARSHIGFARDGNWYIVGADGERSAGCWRCAHGAICISTGDGDGAAALWSQVRVSADFSEIFVRRDDGAFVRYTSQ